MSTEEPAASPMPNHTRHGGSEPEGRADRIGAPVISVGGVRCRHCGFLVAEKSGGLACKSGEPCPFHGKTIEYLAPPGL